MIKIQNINNIILKNQLDSMFDINLMISKIPEIKKELIKYSKIKLIEMLPNQELINQNFEFKLEKSFSLEPISFSMSFIQDNQTEIRKILVNYETEYDYYQKNKNIVLNKFASMNLINTYKIDLFLMHQLELNNNETFKEILKERYPIEEFDKNYSILDLMFTFNKLKKENDENINLKMYNYSVNSFKDNILLDFLLRSYSKKHTIYFYKIKLEDFNDFILIDKNLKDTLNIYVKSFIQYISSNEKYIKYISNERLDFFNKYLDVTFDEFISSFCYNVYSNYLELRNNN